MLKNWKVTLTCLGYGALMTGMLAGCSGQQKPPAPEKRPVQEVKIPAPQEIANPKVFAYLKVNDLSKTIDRVGEWVSIAQPSMNGGVIKSLVQANGIALSDFRAGAPLSAFLFDPAASPGMPPVAALLPIPSTSPTAQNLGRMVGNNIAAQGQDTLLAKTPEALAEAKANAAATEAINKTAAPSDLQLVVNTQVVMAKYGETLNTQIKTLQAKIAAAPGPNPAAMAQAQRMLGAEAQAFQDAMAQCQLSTVGFSFDPQVIDLSLIFKAKPGTGLEKALKKAPVAVPELSQYLDPTASLKMVETVRDMKGFMDLYMKYLALAFTPEQTASLNKMKEELKDFEKIGQVTMALSMGLTPQGKLAYEGVMVSGDNKAFMDLIDKKTIMWMNQGAVHDLYKGMGVDISVKEDKAPRQYKGWTIRHYSMLVKPTAQLPAEQRAMMEKLLGDLSLDVAEVGDYVVFSMGQPLEKLADRLYLKEGLKPIESVRAYPAGGVFYLDMNLSAMFNLMKMSMPPAQAAKLPNLPANTPAIMAAGYHTDGMAYYRLGIPRGLVATLASMRQGGGAPSAGMAPQSPMPIK